MLDVRNLEVWYGITEVLRDVSFTVPAGSIVALLGGNGSGKTTLVNAVSGLHPPRAGAIVLDGLDTTRASADRMVRLGVVQVPQGREVFADMTVKDNLELGAAARRDARSIRADLDEVFTLFPILKERRLMRAGALSGGEQTQLAIGRALMARPRLLLMDEPSVGLAPRIVEILIETVRTLRARGLTILLVEQNVGVAAAVADQAHVLKDGVVAYSGPARDLIGNAEVLSSYLGR
jgi:branched-chain amino acid transport system ATP-binding protein